MMKIIKNRKLMKKIIKETSTKIVFIPFMYCLIIYLQVFY